MRSLLTAASGRDGGESRSVRLACLGLALAWSGQPPMAAWNKCMCAGGKAGSQPATFNSGQMIYAMCTFFARSPGRTDIRREAATCPPLYLPIELNTQIRSPLSMQMHWGCCGAMSI